MQRRGLTAGACVATALALGGCAPRSAQPEVPAVLTNPTRESRAEIARIVSEAMNGAPVTLADDALTADGTLVVERAAPGAAKDMNLRGRDLDRPEHFQVFRSGSRCVLVHAGTSRRWHLASATCSPR